LIGYPSQREDSYGVNITKDDAGIVVTFPYNPLLVEKIKTIPYHRWHPEKKFWSFPKRSCSQQKNRDLYSSQHTDHSPNKKPIRQSESIKKGVINDKNCQSIGFLAFQPELG